MSFVGIMKKLQIQSVKFISGSFHNIDLKIHFITFFIVCKLDVPPPFTTLLI